MALRRRPPRGGDGRTGGAPAPAPGLGYERRVLLLAAVGAAPAVVLAMWLLWGGPVQGLDLKARLTLTLIVLAVWAACVYALHEGLGYRLRTMANLLEALREGDYSLRGRRARREDALGEVLLEINSLAEALRAQRLRALEATALLRRVLAEIDVAVFVVDRARRLRMINRAGERLLGRPAEWLLDRTADEVGLAPCLEGDTPRLIDLSLAAGGKWDLRRGIVWEGGRPHELIVLADVTAALRSQEREAWQRLIQVLRHEINNSLAPIHSLAGSLADLLDRRDASPDWETDVREGLGIIAERSRALGRFMASYARLTKLPPPRRAPLDVADWVRRVAALETRARVEVVPGPPVVIDADGDQLDQLLINLVTNAVDAVLDGQSESSVGSAAADGPRLAAAGGVRVGWGARDAVAEVWVEDDGPGLPSEENLFVPFFTTKPKGSGVGLVLSRQIAEGHGGALALVNRPQGKGCRATVRLPGARSSEASV